MRTGSTAIEPRFFPSYQWPFAFGNGMGAVGCFAHLAADIGEIIFQGRKEENGMCEFNKELTNEELEQVSGGVNVDDGICTIRVSYSATDSRNRIRDALIREMQSHGIRTDRVPSAYTLWEHGMTAGARAGILVYECRSDGSMIRCYRG